MQGCMVARLHGCKVARLQGCKLQVSGFRWQVSRLQVFEVAGCRFKGFRLQVVGCRFQGFNLQVVGFRLLVSGCRLKVAFF